MDIKTYVASSSKKFKIPVWLVKLFFSTISLFFYLIGAREAIHLAQDKKPEYAVFLFLTFVTIGLCVRVLKNTLIGNNLLMVNKETGESGKITLEEYKALNILRIAELDEKMEEFREGIRQEKEEAEEQAFESLEEKIEKIS